MSEIYGHMLGNSRDFSRLFSYFSFIGVAIPIHQKDLGDIPKFWVPQELGCEYLGTHIKQEPSKKGTTHDIRRVLQALQGAPVEQPFPKFYFLLQPLHVRLRS